MSGLLAPMGLTDKPGSWSCSTLSSFGGDHSCAFLVVNLDDICTFSKSKDEHLVRLEAVFIELRRIQLFTRKNKCEFMRFEVAFLRHVVSGKSIAVYPRKVEAVT